MLMQEAKDKKPAKYLVSGKWVYKDKNNLQWLFKKLCGVELIFLFLVCSSTGLINGDTTGAFKQNQT